MTPELKSKIILGLKIWAVTMALLFAVAILTSGGDDEDASASGDAVEKKADHGSVSLVCEYSGEKVKKECTAGMPCPSDVTKSACYTELLPFLPVGATKVNNWEKDGHWESRNGKWALFSFPSEGIDKGKMKGDFGANIVLTGQLPETIEDGMVVYGVGKFAKYKQGFLEDTLTISDGILLDEETYKHHDAATRLAHKLASYPTDDSKRRFGEAVEDLWDQHQEALTSGVLSPADIDLIYFFAGASPTAIESKATKATGVRLAKIAAELDNDPFLRLGAISVDWNQDNDWALPTTTAKCHPKPQQGDMSDEDYAALVKTKETLRKQVQATHKKISVSVSRGDFDAEKKGFPVTLNDTEFSLSGKTRVVSETDSSPECCEPIRPGSRFAKKPYDCTSPPGWLGNEPCEGFLVRVNFPYTTVSWDSDLQAKAFFIPSETAEPTWVGTWMSGLNATAIVRTTKVNHICGKDFDGALRVDSSVYTGELAGIEYTYKGEVVHQEIFTEISTAEAQLGPEGWLEAKLAGTLPAPVAAAK
jgi:hypothetical protein